MTYYYLLTNEYDRSAVRLKRISRALNKDKIYDSVTPKSQQCQCELQSELQLKMGKSFPQTGLLSHDMAAYSKLIPDSKGVDMNN